MYNKYTYVQNQYIKIVVFGLFLGKNSGVEGEIRTPVGCPTGFQDRRYTELSDLDTLFGRALSINAVGVFMSPKKFEQKLAT